LIVTLTPKAPLTRHVLKQQTLTNKTHHTGLSKASCHAHGAFLFWGAGGCQPAGLAFMGSGEHIMGP